MAEAMKTGIAGAGSIAFATAAVLANGGHDPMLWSPSGNGTAELAKGAPLRARRAGNGAEPAHRRLR